MTTHEQIRLIEELSFAISWNDGKGEYGDLIEQTDKLIEHLNSQLTPTP